MFALIASGIVLSLLTSQHTEAKLSEFIDMPGSHCGQPHQEIDGAVITSAHLLPSKRQCVLKLATDDKFRGKKFMLRFESISMTDCSASLKIYYDKAASMYNEADEITCHPGDDFSIRKVYYSTGNYLTLVLSQPLAAGSDFRLVVTTYEDTILCDEFKCSNGKCIDKDLVCDGVDHCFDNSDETCLEPMTSGTSLLTVTVGTIVAIIIAIIVICIICCVVVVVCCRRQRVSRGTVLRQPGASTTVMTSTTNVPPPPPSYASGAPVPAQPMYGGNYPMQAYPQQQAAPPAPAGGYHPLPTAPPVQGYSDAAYPPPPSYQPPGGVYPPPPDQVHYQSGTDQVKFNPA